MKCSKAEELIGKLKEQRKNNFQESQKMRAYVRHPEPLLLPESDKSVTLDIMRPVPCEVMGLLYKGISHENEGRWLYLQKRMKEQPRNRYYFPETTSFGYGWHEVKDNLNCGRRFGKSSAPRKDCYRRNGIQRDPSHWRSPYYNNFTHMNETL